MEHFFPQIQVKTKQKKVFTKNGTLFSPNSSEDQKKKGLHQIWNTFFAKLKCTLTLRCTPESNYWGGCRCKPYSNYWGGYSQIIEGICPPHPPRVSAPLLEMFQTNSTTFAWHPILTVNKFCPTTYQIWFLQRKGKYRVVFWNALFLVFLLFKTSFTKNNRTSVWHYKINVLK